jgi:hypothetical protein
MTAVIAFPKRLTNEQGSTPMFGPAQVIIFNGVRQERLRDDGQDVGLQVARKARRSSSQNQATAEELE